MIVQLDLDSLAAEQAAADNAIAQADTNTDPGWADRAYAAVEHCARLYPTFIVDAIWATGLPEPHEARAIGAVMRRAARDGVIESTDRVIPSTRAGCHANPRRVWRSRIYEASS